MKKKVITTLTAIAVCTAMTMPAMAATEVVPVPEGTDVYAGVIVDNDKEDPQIRVTVPTTFAFVVNGSSDASDTTELSSANGSILLPNVVVKVNDHAINNGSFSVGAEGDSVMEFCNYSTKNNVGTREGAAVELSGYILDEGSEAERNYWNHVTTAPGNTDADFKNYLISVGGHQFSNAVGDRDYMNGSVTLAAPTSAIDTATKLATKPSKTELDFDVKVGGARGMYSQVEESAKVGTITWIASYTYENNGPNQIETAPSNDPLELPQP